jgi:hypothetical protein
VQTTKKPEEEFKFESKFKPQTSEKDVSESKKSQFNDPDLNQFDL